MAMALRAASRVASRRMSSLAVAGQAASVQLNQEGLAELPKTLPIHKRGEDQLVREGAQARMASGGERPTADRNSRDNRSPVPREHPPPSPLSALAPTPPTPA